MYFNSSDMPRRQKEKPLTTFVVQGQAMAAPYSLPAALRADAAANGSTADYAAPDASAAETAAKHSAAGAITAAKAGAKATAEAGTEPAAKAYAKTSEANAQARRIDRVNAGGKRPCRIRALLAPGSHFTGLHRGNAQLLKLILKFVHDTTFLPW